MIGMHTRATLGLAALSGLLLSLAGCPDTQAVYDEFNAAWCSVPGNVLDGPPSNYCSCSTDADCGAEDSGKVCGGDSICRFGCRAPGANGNGCPAGIDCSVTDPASGEIGECGVTCSGAPAAPGDVDGLYYFTLAPPQSATNPAPFAVTVTSEPGPPVTITFDIQPVSADDRVTPVGDAFQRGPFELLDNGSYAADWGEIIIPGDTNPLTGSDLTANFRLVGRFCADQVAEPACGQGLGEITSPVSLVVDGTNLYFEPIDTIADHTEPPFLGCDGSQADPL